MTDLMSQGADVNAYWFAGLRIVSDFPLFGLPLCHDSTTVRDEIVVRRGRTPGSLSSAAAMRPNGQHCANELLLDRPNVARCLVRYGREIVVEPIHLAGDGEIRAFLLSTAFGALFHQRGMLPLHSSVIDVTDGCVAFMGPKRAGKSTTVAALAARGHRVIADDVCCLQLDEKGDLQAWSGINRVRLREDAMTALGYDGPGIAREKHGSNKYFIPARPIHNPAEPRRMRRIYLLLFSPDGQAPTIARLQGAEVVEVLMQNVYRLSLAEQMGFGPAAFAACAVVAKNIPVFRFSRPTAFEMLHKGIEFLEDHLCCAD